jgi:stringent starvation protein B
VIANKSYLARAYNDWIVDSGCTPYLMVDAEQEGVNVPEDFVQDGKIILNVKPEAIRDLDINYDELTFRATFGGEEWGIVVPMDALMAVYAMEDGRGIMFNQDNEGDEGDEPPEGSGGKKSGKPKLRLV